MVVKPINEWKRVFLDTGVIIDFISLPERHAKVPENKERIEKTHKLINELSKREDIMFYISAITLVELTKISNANLSERILDIFSGTDITFVDFTCENAVDINSKLSTVISENNINQFTKELAKLKASEEELFNARQWVLDDIKINAVANGIRYIDAVLTNDNKTFVPIAELLNLPVVFTKNIPLGIFGDVDKETIIKDGNAKVRKLS